MALTSSTADTPLDICSRALILIGAEPISSFDDGTTEATVAVNMYEDVVQAALVNSRWRFATNQNCDNNTHARCRPLPVWRGLRKLFLIRNY